MNFYKKTYGPIKFKKYAVSPCKTTRKIKKTGLPTFPASPDKILSELPLPEIPIPPKTLLPGRTKSFAQPPVKV